ncbi:MAG TPA: ribosome maturation factor RimP [Planosporangium sp.]|jgi:ribosome maturation factor RimP|nr:ribosome maturation factor RimP [Planosporangium sp.]
MPQQRRRAGERTSARPPQRPATGDLAAQRSRLQAVVEPVVTAAGYDLDALSLKRVGRRHQVRVIVDSDEGINLDTVAVLSRDISTALDEAEESGGELVAGEYELEVGSPGIERPLTLPRHWRRNVGRLVKVTVADRSVVGRITAADETGVELDVAGQPRRLAYTELGPGRVQIEFNRLTDLADEELGEIDDEEEGDEE